MVYSTCTLSQEENQHICHYLKDTFGDAVAFESLDTLFDGASAACTPEGFLHVFPQLFDSEGFFIARIRKLTSVNSPMKEKPPRKFPFQPLGKKTQQDLIQHLKTSFQMSLPENTFIMVT